MKVLQFWRILQIDKLLREKKYPNAPKLATLFEMSQRTIERDIDFMRSMYAAPIDFDRKRGGYFYTEESFFLQSLFLNESELFAVALFEKTLAQYKNTPLEKKLRNIFRKLTALLPNDCVSIDSFFFDEAVSFIAEPTPDINEATFNAVFASVKTQHAIRVLYRSLDSAEAEARIIEPYHIVCQRGLWYVLGFCHQRREVRIFSFSRIKAIEVLDLHFEKPKDFSPAKLIDPNIGVWLSERPAFKVRLLFAPEVAAFAEERIWKDRQKIIVHQDQSVEVSFETNQMQEILRFVLGQGLTVKVLEPLELVEAVKAEVEKMRGMYEL